MCDFYDNFDGEFLNDDFIDDNLDENFDEFKIFGANLDYPTLY